MLREWTDDLEPRRAEAIWRRMGEQQLAAEFRRLEEELRAAVERQKVATTSFFTAMRQFLLLRDKLFSDLPGEPALRLLMALAETPHSRGQTSVTGIAYGAGVPLATAIRYIAMMEAKGIVERRPDPDDGRRFFIELTAEGRRRVDQLAGHWMLRVLVIAIVPVALLACALL